MTISPRKIRLERIKSILLGLIIALVLAISASYAYFVNQAVLNVVERENLDREIAEMTSRTVRLEREYAKIADVVDREFSYARGYREPEKTTFISRKPLPESVSLNQPE
jgi:cell division protein FtsI/penicillin-binding protein 2